jgi:hypothetical protein
LSVVVTGSLNTSAPVARSTTCRIPCLPEVATSLRPPASKSDTLVASQSWSSLARSWYHHLSAPAFASSATTEIVYAFAPSRIAFW